MAQILLIEPDRVLAEIYGRSLVAAGNRVLSCFTAQAGIQAADKQQPDLVILELQLVEHSGIEFLYEFRSYPEWQATPVVIHTTVPPNEFSDNWQILRVELGVETYLYKPQTSLKQLIDTAQAQLSVPESVPSSVVA
ncbi:MAG: response regulator [Patescibacteria group bacterium]